MLCFSVGHWNHQFYAFVQVSFHPVRAGDVKLLISPVIEIEDTGMLQKSSNDGTDPDVLAEPFDARTQTADAADDEINFYSIFGCCVELFYDVFVHQRIGVDNDE